MARSNINNKIIRGNFGSVWLNNEKLAEAKKVEAKAALNTEELDINGQLNKEYRYMGWAGSGTLEVHKVNSRIVQLYAEGVKSGSLPEVKMDIVVTDPDVSGSQRCVLYGVVFDEVDLGSWENGTVLSESVPFKFADYEFIETLEEG